jgi:hypothetical protein
MPLARIPFRAQDEAMIASMARWMRFIGFVTIAAGMVAFVFLLIGLSLGGAALRSDDPSLAKIATAIRSNVTAYAALFIFGLLASALSVVAGLALEYASEDFDKAARTDVADQDFIADGLAWLKTYFKINVALAVAGMLVALAAAMSMNIQVTIVG